MKSSRIIDLLLLLVIIKIVTSQNNNNNNNDVETAINTIFTNSSDFLRDYEEVTQPPLESLGALPKCGEDDTNLVCVPYYNCNPQTKTVVQTENRFIDVRSSGIDRKCDHYLDVCCQLSNLTTPPSSPTTTVTTTITTTTLTTSTPINRVEPEDSVVERSPAYCGIRNINGIDFKITGNTQNEAEFGEFPWMVAILNKKSTNIEITTTTNVLCGGSLIAPNVVLTGAHCVNNKRLDDIKIRAGEWDILTIKERIPYQERNIRKILIHEDFGPRTLINDVALLILDRPLSKTKSVGTVCLPQPNQHFRSNECYATGWGKTSFGADIPYNAILKKIQLPLVIRDKCQKALQTTRLGEVFQLDKSFMCAGGEFGIDTCTGDGGSPLVCPDPINPNRYLQVGIVAWGIGCGENRIPGVYADVATFRHWIDKKLSEEKINIQSYQV